MPKFTATPTPTPAVDELSPARRQLAELQDAREIAMAESKTLSERQARLQSAHATVATLETELARIAQAESFAALHWAEADDGSPAPLPDTSKRGEIEGKIAAAKAAARAADSATASVGAQLTKTNEHLAALQPRITQAAATIVAEEAEALFPELAEAIAAVEAVRIRITTAREFMIRATVAPAGKAVGAVRLNFERFDRGFELASARPMPASDGAGEWSGFASRLERDATATLEGFIQ
jgi:hypothetical protein